MKALRERSRKLELNHRSLDFLIRSVVYSTLTLSIRGGHFWSETKLIGGIFLLDVMITIFLVHARSRTQVAHFLAIGDGAFLQFGRVALVAIRIGVLFGIGAKIALERLLSLHQSLFGTLLLLVLQTPTDYLI